MKIVLQGFDAAGEWFNAEFELDVIEALDVTVGDGWWGPSGTEQ